MVKPRKKIKKMKTMKKLKKMKKRAVTKKTTKAPKKKIRKTASASPPAPGAALKKGDTAPDFRIPNDAGHETGLSDFRGRRVILYFYPKDDTAGCTLEARSFRDGMAAITERGASVVGVSCDTVESHHDFKEKYGLNFHLLSDTDREVVRKYGVWRDAGLQGDTPAGIDRTTFLIDEKGKIKKIFRNVDVETHYDEVLKALG